MSEIAEIEIKDMAIGQVGYVNSGGIYSDDNDNYFIRGDIPFCDKPERVVCIKIQMLDGKVGIVKNTISKLSWKYINDHYKIVDLNWMITHWDLTPVEWIEDDHDSTS